MRLIRYFKKKYHLKKIQKYKEENVQLKKEYGEWAFRLIPEFKENQKRIDYHQNRLRKLNG